MRQRDIQALREVAEAATPGPWYWEPPSGDSWPLSDESLRTHHRVEGEDYDPSVLYGWGYDASGIEGEPADRAHIATFDPPTVLALLDRLEAAEADAAKLREVAAATIKALARVESLAEKWNSTPDYAPSGYDQGRVDQRHDMTTELYEALSDAETADAPGGHGDAAGPGEPT